MLKDLMEKIDNMQEHKQLSRKMEAGRKKTQKEMQETKHFKRNEDCLG